MESLSEFLRRSADDTAQRTVEAAQIVIGADPVKPEEAAADLTTATDFAKLTGNPSPPLPVVREHRNVFAGLIEEKRRASALAQAPKLADWLRDPDNAAISKDDLDNLSGFEVFARGVGEQVQGLGADAMRFGGRLSITADQAAASNLAERNADRLKSLAEIYEQQRAHIGVEGQLLDPVIGPFGDILFTGTRYLSAQLDSLFGNDTEAKAAFYQQRAAETSAWVNEIKMPPTAEAARQGVGEAMQKGTMGEQVAALGEVIARDPAGFLGFIAHTAVESAPFIAAAVGVGAATRNPGAAMATMFAGSTAASTGEQALEFVREAGHDLSTPEGALAAIRDPNLLAAAQQRGLTYGLFVGAVDAISGGVAGEALSKSPLASMLLQTFLVQPAFGAGGEALGQTASGQSLNVVEVLIEAMAEIASAPVEVAGFGMERISGEAKKAQAAPATATTLQDLAQAASASKVRERSPDKFREILNGLLGDSAKANLYVPAEAFSTYFQSLGLDPYEIADSLTGIDPGEFDLAMQSGGSVRIPTATWAADMVGGGHDQFVIENAAFAPGDFTVSEAAAFEETKADLVNEAWAAAEAERKDEDTYRPIREQEYDALVSQLRIAGRATDVAVNEALPMVEFRRVMAERMGLDPEEFAARFPLPEVRGALPEGMQLRDVDALTRTLAEARARRTAGAADRGPSLLEFIAGRGGIVDPGGELSARDASVIKRGRGKKTLRLERKGVAAAVGDLLGGKSAAGHGFDDTARAAIEAGYLADDPVALAWLQAQRDGTEVPDIGRALLDAIDREMRGEAQYATEAPAEDGLDNIEQYLSGLGVSLDDDDASIRQAMEGEQRRYAQPDSRQYDQSPLDTRDAAFKRWFGDSKVVDAQGKPLVVYHGTASEFDAFDPAESGQNFASDKGKFFFTGSEAEAERYADGGPVMPVYLSIKKPLIVETGAQAAEEWDERGGLLDDEIASGDYDGVIIYGSTGPMFIAFSPTQIKSVYNRGTFDPTDPRILYQPAYHGTPHLFDKFSTDHIGTGEGAQAFGWGLYFASSKAVSQWYRDELAGKSMTFKKDNETIGRNEFEQRLSVAARVAAKGWDMPLADANLQAVTIASSIAEALKDGDSLADMAVFARKSDWLPSVKDMWQASLAEAQSWEAKKPGRLFEVEVPDDGDLLDWNAPLSDQPPAVLAKLRAAIESAPWRDDILADMDVSSVDELIVALEDEGMSGENSFGFIYNGLSDITGSDEALSKALREAGIPGHRYLDGNSRRAGDGSYNYVIYDDTRVSVRSYEQADMMAPGGGSRGSISFQNGEAVISLFASADLSTFLHETGHYFLSVMQSASRDGGSIADDFSAVKDWWHQHADDVAKDAAKASGVAVSADDVRMALDAGTTGKADLDAAIDTGMQEQFARGFEAYLMEGKAPSIALRSAFEKFRAWLISIYRRALGLNVVISDEMRAVFGRMIATDGEIAAASAEISSETAIPAAADLGMTDDQHAAYVKLHGQAKDEAAARLLADTMAPIRRERDKEYRAEKKKVRAEVERNTNAEPVYRAIEWMTNRRWLAGEAPDGMPDFRLSKSVLVERYGEGVLATLNANRGKQPVYAVDGGLDPDDAAGWFGFTSGDALVKAIERAPNRVEAINAETEKVMRERHGDPLTDGTLERKAMAAVHNDKRAQVLALELKTLNEVAGLNRSMTAKEAREAARRSIAGMRTRDAVNAARWLAAERKAGQEVARLMGTVSREKLWVDAARRRVAATALAAARRGDADVSAVNAAVDRANAALESADVQFEVADRTITTKAGPRVVPGGERTAHVAGYNENVAKLIEAKRRQMLNHALYTEALAVAEEVEAAERLVTRLSKSLSRRRAQSGKQSISNEALDAIAEQIDRYDFRRMSGPAEERRGKLAAYVEWMRSAGRENELAIPRAVMEEAGRVPYKTLTVERLRGVVDTLKNLESTGRRWQTLRIKGEQREFDASVSAVVSGIEGNIGSSETPWVEEGWIPSAKGGLNQYLATFQTASTIIRRMDGRADLGPVYELLKGDIDKAAYDERDMRSEAAGKIEKLYSVYSLAEQRQMAVMRSMPELGGSFSKWNVIAMALNMGNVGNLSRLTNKSARKHLTAAQVETVKATLDKRDWDFVQSIWDYLDTYRPMIAERQKRVTGVEPEWVEASPVVTPHGTYRGGYYPIKYTGKQGGAATPSLSGEADIIQSMQLGGYAKAATKNGHLEARTANVQQSLLLDVGVIATHSNEVIHDLAFSEPVVNTWRLLNDKRVADAMLSAGMQEQGEALKLWLKDVAVGQVFASDFMSKSLRNLRSGFTVSRLALNATTALLQPTGLFQSATVVGKRRLANAIISYTRNPAAMVDEVLHRSRIMNDRRTTFQKDLMDMVAETNIASPKASRFKRAVDKYVVPFSLLAMTYTQFYVVDVPTWAAAYAKGMKQFDGNQQKAGEYADMTINRVQGSGLWSERSNIERGTLSATVRQSAFVTLFTTLGSYFFAKMNLLIERTDRLRGEPVSIGSAASYAADVSMLLAAEAAVLMLVEMGKDALLGDNDEDDEDENPAMNLGVEALKTFAAGLPGIRDAVSVMQGFSGGTYASLLDLITAPAQQALQGELDVALAKSLVNLTGIVTRLPASQANRIIDAGWRDFEGEDVAVSEYLFGRPR
ncbi:MAG: hypothetical protein F2813_00310 [Actinobacteria bacterium]|uniref:Unannotated protein n=1 Tax=freshwater metagenome TaxID=449393 RepID=A0A6J5Z268_9ZZZZ|nr:hypothetical protein [Actinomycetota bacterium]